LEFIIQNINFQTKEDDGVETDPPPYSGNLVHAEGSGSTSRGESLTQKLIRILEIPPHLVGPGKANLQTSYQKYLAFLQAKDRLESVEWEGRKPPQVELIQLFASKSYFFSHHKKFFPKVASYPQLDAWLREKEDRLSNLEVWGIEKKVYSFEDLETFLANGGTSKHYKLYRFPFCHIPSPSIGSGSSSEKYLRKLN
jgi:hypothetical protein